MVSNSLTDEFGPMFAWDPIDEHGEESFLDYRRNVNEARTNMDPLVDAVMACHANLEPLTVPLDDEGGGDREKQIRDHLARLYGRLRCNAAIRKMAAQEREIKDKERYLTSKRIRAWYWIRPAVFFFLCFCIQSIFLHIATHYYIKYMDTYNMVLNMTHVDVDVPQEDVKFKTAIDRGSLYDPVASGLEPEDGADLPLWLIDLSGIVPLALWVTSYVVTVWLGDSQISMWTKTCFIGGLMALLKGSCDLITILPDSSGWQKCEERMGIDGLHIMREDLAFSRGDFFSSLGKLLKIEIVGTDEGRLRYCADMLISGHTYFAVLCSLSTYKMLRHVTEKYNKRWLRRLTFFVCLTCVVIEISVVLMSRWNSMWVESIASKWTEGYMYRDDTFKGGGWAFSIFGCAKKNIQDVQESMTAMRYTFSKGSISSAPSSPDCARQERGKICTSRSRKLWSVDLDRSRLIDANIQVQEDFYPEWLRPRRMTLSIMARQSLVRQSTRPSFSSLFRPSSSRLSVSFLRPSEILSKLDLTSFSRSSVSSLDQNSSIDSQRNSTGVQEAEEV